MRSILVAVPLFIALTLRLVIGGAAAFPTDDTYITIHAAHHLFTGVDPSYPEGAGLVGVTSPLHAFVLWALMRVMPTMWAAELLTWLGALFYLFAAATFLCRQLTHRWEQALGMTVAVLAGFTSQHLASGQETAWAMGATVWAMDALLRDPPRRFQAVLLAVLLPWIRPDLLLWSAAILWRLRRTDRVFLVRAGATVGLSVGGYLLANKVGAGTWLPNTVDAKRYFFAEYAFRVDLNVAAGVFFLTKWIVKVGPAALALIAGLAEKPTALATRIFFFMWLALSLNGAAAFEHNFFRYAQPFVLPAILVGLCVRHVLTRRILLVTSVIWCLVFVPHRWASYQSSLAIVAHAQGAIATWLNSHADPQSKVLVHDAGFLSEATNFQLVDLVGLKTPSSTKWHREFTGPSKGRRRGEAVRAIACAAAPSYYVAFSHWEGMFDLTYSLTRAGWVEIPVLRYHVDWPEGPSEFTLYKLIVPPGCPPKDGR